MDTDKKRMLVALEDVDGVVSVACKNAGIARSTYYGWLKADEEFKALVDELADVAIDTVESELFKRIKSGDTTAMIFYLKTRAKKRGYIEKQEHDVNHKGITLNFVPAPGCEPIKDE